MKRILFILIILLAAHASFGQCNPSFTASFTPYGNDLLEYSFANTTNYTPVSGHVVHYSMNYGDGVSNSNLQHNYNATGIYTVTMTMTVADSGNNGTIYCTDSTSQVINVNYSPCGASLSYSVTTQNTTEETVSFTADNPAGTSGMSYSWTFGDGGTGTGANPSHTYTQDGNYVVTLTAIGGGCTYTNSNTTIIQVGSIIDCNTLTTSISDNVSYYTVNFTDNHTVPSTYQGCTASWVFGDGNTGNGLDPSHTYTASGTYSVTLTTNWTDSNTNAVLCTQNATTNVTVTTAPPPPPNIISGSIHLFNGNISSNSTGIVWLITYDSSTHLLEAIDSTTITTDTTTAQYEFDNEPNNVYRIKAALLNNNPPGSSGFIPTYYNTSLYWSSANTLSHTGGDDEGINIYMQYGTVPSGTGFVAGNVLSGANKSTGTTGGIPAVGMMIYLRDASNNILTYTYTDVNGNYTFSNIANGSYSIYPEAINYATTPFTGITVNGQVNNINFKQNTTALTIEPVTTGISNVSANTNVNIYPNPTTGNITINWQQPAIQKAQLTIIDVIGREVYNTDMIMSAGNGSARLNLSKLQNGIYTVQLRSSDLNYTQKLVIAGK